MTYKVTTLTVELLSNISRGDWSRTNVFWIQCPLLSVSYPKAKGPLYFCLNNEAILEAQWDLLRPHGSQLVAEGGVEPPIRGQEPTHVSVTSLCDDEEVMSLLVLGLEIAQHLPLLGLQTGHGKSRIIKGALIRSLSICGFIYCLSYLFRKIKAFTVGPQTSEGIKKACIDLYMLGQYNGSWYMIIVRRTQWNIFIFQLFL